MASRAVVGRTDLHAAVDTEGRTDDRRSDFDNVYGDWDSLRGMDTLGRSRSSEDQGSTETSRTIRS